MPLPALNSVSSAATASPPESFRAWLTFPSVFALGVMTTLTAMSIANGAGSAVLGVVPWFASYAFLMIGSFALRVRYPRAASFVRYFQHLAIYGAMYAGIHGMMTAARPQTVDAGLAHLDRLIFGVNPVAWLGLHGFPLLTDLLALSYFSYYFGMPILLIRMWRKSDALDFRAALSAVTIGWYIALVSYYLFPALGPQRFMPAQLPHLTGWLPTTALIRDFLHANLTPVVRDCVPSMHTGVTLLTLAFAWRYDRRFFWMYLPGGIGLIIATVYLQQHYAIDVILGFAAFVLIDRTVRALRPL